jgi:hypothetical protein
MQNVRKMKGIDHLGDLGAEGKIILKWILKKGGCEDVNGFICLEIGSIDGML